MVEPPVPAIRRPDPRIIRVHPTPIQNLWLHHEPKVIRRSGGSRFAERPHDRAKSSTEFVGIPAQRITLPLFFDALRPRRQPDVERELAMLGAWAAQPGGTIVRINFAHGQELLWDLDDYREISDERVGARVQARVEVDLLEHREATLALSPVEQVEQAAAEGPEAHYTRPADGGAGSTRTYTVRAGDDLSSIAARELGAASRWTEIYQLNTPDPMSMGPDVILPGWVLRLPQP